MIQDVYKQQVTEGMEDLVGSKLLHLFSDAKIDEDMAVSVFIFEKPIEGWDRFGSEKGELMLLFFDLT